MLKSTSLYIFQIWLITVKFKQRHLPDSERQEFTNKMLLEVEGLLATIPMELSFCQNALLVSIKTSLHRTLGRSKTL